MPGRRPPAWVEPRREHDRQLAAVALDAAARSAGLDPAAVEARPRLAAHAPVRRAAVFALVDLGFTHTRALHACRVTRYSLRPPDLWHIVAAKDALAPAIAARTNEVRAVAVEIEAVTCEIFGMMHRHLAAETHALAQRIADRIALLDKADALGIEPGELAAAIGVSPNAVTRWRRIRYVPTDHGALRHVGDDRDLRRARKQSARLRPSQAGGSASAAAHTHGPTPAATGLS